MFDPLKQIDKELFLTINSWHSVLLDETMFYVSKIWIFFPLFFYWFYLIYKSYGKKKLVILMGFIVLLIALTDQTSTRVKHIVKRYRPTHNLEIKDKVHIVNDYRGGKYGFFSGHSANCFGVATLLYLLFNKRKKSFKGAFFLWASVTAYSRIYLGVHYPSDIFMGLIVGVFWGFIIYKLIQATFQKYYNEIVSL